MPTAGCTSSRCAASCPTSPAPARTAPIGRIVVLEDTDDDGKMDKRTVFLDSLVLPRAVKVLVARRARRRAAEPLVRARHERRPEGGHEGARARRLRHAAVEPRAQRQQPHRGGSTTGSTRRTTRAPPAEATASSSSAKTPSRGQWGVSMDDDGPHLPQQQRGPAARRPRAGPLLRRATRTWCATRGSYENARRHQRVNAVLPAHPTPGVNRGYQRRRAARRRHARRLHRPSQRRRSTVGDRLPAELRRQRLRHRAGRQPRRAASSSSDDGDGTLHGDEGVRAGASSSPRPTSASGRSTCRHAPDGTLYVVDMYRGIIQHRAFITGLPRGPDHASASSSSRSASGGSIASCTTTTRRDSTAARSRRRRRRSS